MSCARTCIRLRKRREHASHHKNFVPWGDSQLEAKDLPNPAQRELALSRKGRNVAVAAEVIQLQRTFSAALGLACQTSGLEDKEIYVSLDIDAGQWSRIRKGDAHFPGDKFAQFCDLVRNDIIIQWLAYQRGYGLVMLKSEAERRAEEAEKRAQEAEQRVAWLTELLQGKK